MSRGVGLSARDMWGSPWSVLIALNNPRQSLGFSDNGVIVQCSAFETDFRYPADGG